ncbi:branched-chain amino acid ABC transporter permease [Microvirga sp. 2YAF29]|uniref:branched-chain amino acid ABC transporter permease n=1 Tax=Microvirga sp. 2YAF29 TaxID=3233031 RepID=UPI003F9D4B11
MVFYIQLILNGVVQGLVIGLGALAITLVFGVARFPNAATGDYMTLGAYGALGGYSISGSLIVGGLVAIIVTAAWAVAVHLLIFRRLTGRPVVALMIVSIGIGFLLRALLGLSFGHSQHVIQLPLTRPYLIGGLRISPLDLQLAAVAGVMLAIIFGTLHLTSIGRKMRAVSDNRDLARVSGIRPEPVMIALWVLAGATAAIAGMVLGIKTVVTPEIGWDMLLPVFAAAIFGGIGSPIGAVLAGLLIGVAQELSTPFVGFTYKIALSFIVMLVVLLVRPQGLFGKVEGAR